VGYFIIALQQISC